MTLFLHVINYLHYNFLNMSEFNRRIDKWKKYREDILNKNNLVNLIIEDNEFLKKELKNLNKNIPLLKENLNLENDLNLFFENYNVQHFSVKEKKNSNIEYIDNLIKEIDTLLNKKDLNYYNELDFSSDLLKNIINKIGEIKDEN